MTIGFRISWAQNREDFLIEGFFPDIQHGHYVDVGAAHPSQYSVTKLFYDRGWDGINIEPLPDLAAELRSERPRDVTLAVALGAEGGTAEFRRYAGTGLSTMNTTVIAEHEAESTPLTHEFEDLEVEVTTLAEVLQAHPLPHLHFLKVDVEGSEYEVLVGNDWDRFRPELICIETDHIVRDWTPLLTEARYEQVFHDGLNAYYLAEESLHRASHFHYPKAALDAPTLVTPEVGSELGDLHRLRTEVIPQQEAEVAALREELGAVRAQAEADHAAVEAARATAEEKLAAAEAQIAALNAQLDTLQQSLAAETGLRATYAAREAELSTRLTSVEGYLNEVLGSHSWRLTKPFRVVIARAKARVPRQVKSRVRQRRLAHVVVAKPSELISVDGATMLAHLTALDELEVRR